MTKKKKTIILTLLGVTVIGIYILLDYFAYWEIIGFFFLKTLLGMNTLGAKTFTMAVVKVGGKKAILFTTFGVLIKRHVIDILTKFFMEHSVKRYQKSIKQIINIQIQKIKDAPMSIKIRNAFVALGTYPALSFFWTKVIGGVLQKMLYKLFFPLILAITNVLLNLFGFVGSFFYLIFQVVIINFVMSGLEGSRTGRGILKGIDFIIYGIGNLFDLLNDVLKKIGLDPKHRLIVLSYKINNWLESIIDKGENTRCRLLIARERRLNNYELLQYNRNIRQASKKKKMKTIRMRIRRIVNRKIKKQIPLSEKREKREAKRVRTVSPIKIRHKRGYHMVSPECSASQGAKHEKKRAR